MFKTKLLFVFTLIFSLSAFGQSIQTIEKELVGQLENLNRNSSYAGNSDYDSLTKANEVFTQSLLKHTKNPLTLKHKFTELDKLLIMATSEDGKFRVYSWDTEDGGTMHNFNKIYQYQAADGKVYSRLDDNNEGAPFVHKIQTLDTKNGKVYLVFSTGIGSTKFRYDTVNLYKISGNALDDKVKLIRTKEGLTNKISFTYDFFSVVDEPERPIDLILFEKATNTLKIPIVLETKEFPDGAVTKRFISYKFNGTNFVKVN